MRLFTLSLFIIVVISMLGCSAENPICSTNFCAVGEVFHVQNLKMDRRLVKSILTTQ